MDKKVVLFIDRNQTWAAVIDHGLGSGWELVRVSSFADADQKLSERPDIKAIVVGLNDGSAHSFVKKAVAGRFSGPLIAATDNVGVNNELKSSAGCTHAMLGKYEVVHFLRSSGYETANAPAGS